MLGILGLSVSGLSLVARVKMLAAWATVAVLAVGVASGLAYWQGRTDGRAMAAAEAARVAFEIAERDRAFRESEDAEQRAALAEAAETENANDAIAEILTRPEAGDDRACLSGQWLHGLGRLR